MKIGTGRFVDGVFEYEDGIIVPEGCRIQVTEEISVRILDAKEGERITNVRIYSNPEYEYTKTEYFDFILASTEDHNDSKKMCLVELHSEEAEITGFSVGSIPFFDPDHPGTYASSGTKTGFFLWEIGDGFIVSYKSDTLCGEFKSIDGKIVFE